MISVKQAKDIILNSTNNLNSEKVQLLKSYNRILAQDLYSQNDMPLFDNSAMDGFAVLYEDTIGASKENPISLQIIGTISAGSNSDFNIISGQAVKIMTGAKMPNYADAVVIKENTFEKDNKVYIEKEAKKQDNIRLIGSDVKKGDLLIEKGKRLGTADIGVLASNNFKKVCVFTQPKIAILSTGDELVNLGKKLAIGKIRNSNTYSLYSQVKKYGAIPIVLGISKDNKDEIINKIGSFNKYDIVIISGGISVGDFDFTKKVFSELGVKEKFWSIAVKPGKPIYFGVKEKCLFFGLPGNPVSTIIGFEQFIAIAIEKLCGIEMQNRPIIKAKLEADYYKKNDGKTHFVRAIYKIENGEFFVCPLSGFMSSSNISSMSKANCLIILGQDEQNLKIGEKVEIQLTHFNSFEV